MSAANCVGWGPCRCPHPTRHNPLCGLCRPPHQGEVVRAKKDPARYIRGRGVSHKEATCKALRTNFDGKTLRRFGPGIAAGGIELLLREAFGAAKIGAFETCDRERGVREIRAVEFRVREIGAGEIGMAER